MMNNILILDHRYSDDDNQMPAHVGFFDEAEVQTRARQEGLNLSVRTLDGSICFVVTSGHERNVFLDRVLPSCKMGR